MAKREENSVKKDTKNKETPKKNTSEESSKESSASALSLKNHQRTRRRTLDNLNHRHLRKKIMCVGNPKSP